MKTSIRLFHWMPRVICILAILFVSMFAADAFGPGRSFAEQLGDFIIHLIPSFILLAILFVAWKWELIGGILFLVIGLGLSPFIYKLNYNMNQSVWMSLKIILIITVPFIIVGALFIMSHFLKKKNPPVLKD
jgi:hypothetical protein